jgi:hypothetical protein
LPAEGASAAASSCTETGGSPSITTQTDWTPRRTSSADARLRASRSLARIDLASATWSAGVDFDSGLYLVSAQGFT